MFGLNVVMAGPKVVCVGAMPTVNVFALSLVGTKFIDPE